MFLLAARKKQIGVTLLEVILVMAIASVIIFAGFRQYLSMRRDADVMQLQANVDAIFSAMALYYKQNCYGQMNPRDNPPLTPGTLNPNNSTPPTDPFPIDIDSDLIKPGFLTTPIEPGNPIIDDQVGNEGYIAQFNMYTNIRYVCTQATGSTGATYDHGCLDEDTGRKQVGTIIFWRPQIAIHMKDPTLVQQYAAWLNADCISTEDTSTKTIFSCSDPKRSEGEFLVWERSPSYVAASNSSSLWQLNPTVQQFNQQYSVYPINYLTTTSPYTGRIPDGTQQYFLCGG